MLNFGVDQVWYLFLLTSLLTTQPLWVYCKIPAEDIGVRIRTEGGETIIRIASCGFQKGDRVSTHGLARASTRSHYSMLLELHLEGNAMVFFDPCQTLPVQSQRFLERPWSSLLPSSVLFSDHSVDYRWVGILRLSTREVKNFCTPVLRL